MKRNYKTKYLKYKRKYLIIREYADSLEELEESKYNRNFSTESITDEIANEEMAIQMQEAVKDKDLTRIFAIINSIAPTKAEPNDIEYESPCRKCTCEDRRKMDNELDKRDMYVTYFSYAIPTRSVVEKIVDFADKDGILHLDSGPGLWASILQIAGAKIKPTDIVKYKYAYTDVKNLDYMDAIHRYGIKYNTLLLIWPPYDSGIAYEAVKNFGGKKLVYIGEAKNGCTGNKDLYELLQKEWTLYKQIDIPKWPNMKDSCYMYIKNIDN